MYTKLVAPLATLALTGVMMTAAAAQVNAAEATASSQIISSLVNPQAPQATTQPVPIEQGDFVGTFTLTKFVNDKGHLYAIGVVSGTNTATGQSGSETVTLPVTHASNPQPSSAAAGTALAVTPNAVAPTATCSILDLTLGPLHLNLLGLIIDLNQIHLTITAQQGQLLGNLLCGIANALNSGQAGGLAALLNRILGLLG